MSSLAFALVFDQGIFLAVVRADRRLPAVRIHLLQVVAP